MFFFSSPVQKLIKFQFCDICGYKKKGRKTKFSPLLFCCYFWIRDPVWIKIRIRDKHPGSATLAHNIIMYISVPLDCGGSITHWPTTPHTGPQHHYIYFCTFRLWCIYHTLARNIMSISVPLDCGVSTTR
jgi:hypothetical protein